MGFGGFGGWSAKTGPGEVSRLGPIKGQPPPAFRPFRFNELPAPKRGPASAQKAPESPPRPPGHAGKKGVAIVGRFSKWPWGQFPDEAYMASALESVGVRVWRLEASASPQPVPEAAWAVFTAQPESRGNMPKWTRTHSTVLWTLDWLPYYEERKPIIELAKRATVFVTSDRYDWRRLQGIGHHRYLPAACENVDFEFREGPPWRRPCAFMGSIYNDRRSRIAAIVEGLGGEVRSAPGAWIYGGELARYVQETKVVVGDNAWNDIPYYWSSRNYIVPGLGGFLLTPRVPGLETNLREGVHVACYGSLDELRQELGRWIADDEGRERIRRAGLLHVLENHNWKVRAEQFASILRTYSKESV